MIIGVDGNEANVEKKVGIGEYAYELLKQFININPDSIGIKYQIYLKDLPRNDMPRESENWQYIVVKPGKLWTQIGLPFYLFTHFTKPDVFFSPTHYAPRFSPVKTAISIMDLSFLHYPQLFAKKDLYQLVNWTRYSARNAKKIFTISNVSKDDIIKEYGKSPEDVIVTYPGIRKELITMNNELSKKDLENKYGISESYILFVGTLQPRKNIVRLIEAFSIIKKPHPGPLLKGEGKQGGSNLQLVVVGKKGWLYEEILTAPEKNGVSDWVKFLDFVPTEDLPRLYKNALCFVLPSLYEGFGLPILEAMKYGCPVITSNVSSLPEAGGNAAIYVNPENVNDIAEKLKKVISDEKLRISMVQKGYNHIKKFSWEKTAKETLNVLIELGKHER